MNISTFCFFQLCALLAAVLGINYQHILGHGAKLWSEMEPKPCQTIEVAARLAHASLQPQEGSKYSVTIYFRLLEDMETPDLGHFGNITAGLIASASNQKYHLLPSRSTSILWQVQVIDTSTWRGFIPEMKFRALRVRVAALDGRVLQANAAGSAVQLAPPEEMSNRSKEWLLALSHSGWCCTLQALGLRMSTQSVFLGLSQNGTALSLDSLEPSQDATIWELRGIPPEWLQYLRQPAPVGYLKQIISVPGLLRQSGAPAGDAASRQAGSHAFGKDVVSVGRIETELGMPDGSLFGGGLMCYYVELPTAMNRASKTWPHLLGQVQDMMRFTDLAHLDTYIYSLIGGIAASVFAQLLALLLLGFGHDSVVSSRWSLRLIPCIFFVTILALAACVALASLACATGLLDEGFEETDIRELDYSGGARWVADFNSPRRP